MCAKNVFSIVMVTFLLLGDKSEVLDIDDPDLDKYPLFPQAERYETELQAGDVLFLPGMIQDTLGMWYLIKYLSSYKHRKSMFGAFCLEIRKVSQTFR